MTRQALAMLTTLVAGSLWAGPALAQTHQEEERARQPEAAVQAFDEGVSAAQKGDLETGLRQLHKACELAPDWSEAQYYLGACLNGLGLHEESIKPFTRAVELDPDYVVAFAARADAHFRLGHYESSTFDWSRVLELRPDLWIALAARAEGYLALGDMDQAMADLNQALQLNPDAGKAYRVRSQAYLLQGKVMEALADATESVDHEPDNPYAGLWLAALQQDAKPLEPFAKTEGWPGELVRYYRDEQDAEALLAKAQATEDETQRRQHECEANCWIALRADLAGDMDQAQTRYAAAVETKAYFLIEYRWSLRRLAQLRAK